MVNLGSIQRHYRNHTELSINKNDVMQSNVAVIENAKTEEECINLLKFTIGTIMGGSYQNDANGIDESFQTNTSLLTGNKNKSCLFARDITRGATIQLFFICLKLESIKTGNAQMKSLCSGEDRLKFILNYTDAFCVKDYCSAFCGALSRNAHYLSRCENCLSANNLNYLAVSYHSNGYSIKIDLGKTGKNLSTLNKVVPSHINVQTKATEITFPFVNHELTTFNFYKFDQAKKKYCNTNENTQDGLNNSTILVSNGKISGECIFENDLYMLSVIFDSKGSLTPNSNGNIFIKHENQSYEYTVDKSGKISYDKKTGTAGISADLRDLEKNILASQNQLQNNNTN